MLNPEILKNSKEIMTTSKNGKVVYYDPLNSHAAAHFNEAEGLKTYVKEVLEETNITDDNLLFNVDMGHIIGETDLVENDLDDVIVYAKRRNRKIYSSFNKTKLSQPSSLVSIILGKSQNESYELVTAWIGAIDSPPFPGDEHETTGSKDYWTSHSLAWGTQEIQPDTETTECPW